MLLHQLEGLLRMGQFLHGAHMVASGHMVDLIGTVNQLRLEGGDKELRMLGQVEDECSNCGSVLSVKSIIELVHDVEGSGFDLQRREEQTRGNHCLLPAREVPESLDPLVPLLHTVLE